MKFESRYELATELYRRVETPGLTDREKMCLAALAAVQAERVWREKAGGS